MRTHKEPGHRKKPRVDLQGRPAFVILAPDGPSIECMVQDISEGGIRIEVGAIPIPKLFGITFTADAKVFRLCELIWRRGSLVGGRFITADDVRQKLCGNAPTPLN